MSDAQGLRKSRAWLRYLLLIPAALLFAFVVWGSTPLGPDPVALAALESDSAVLIEAGRMLAFRPTDQEPTVGLILYPGGRVDYRSYAPLARGIAAQGYLVVIPRMPLNLAVFAPERATQVMEAYPAIRGWAVGGHSLGGAMAARYAHAHPTRVQGLVLWASYPADGNSMAMRSDLAVVSIYGTRDGLAGADEIEASRALLPASTRWVAIDGGNHAQFGSYGTQKGDLAATLTRAEQHRLVVQATVQLLAEVAP